MITKYSVRPKNKANFLKCITLRKQGLSYREIGQVVPICKSTLNNWLTLAGLTLTAEHLNIQSTKRIENHIIATEASKVTRRKKYSAMIQKTIYELRPFFKETLFISGIMLFEAEGSKQTSCHFSNSDYRLILTFIRFIEKYFGLSRQTNIGFAVYIHVSREDDLGRIVRFWSKKLAIADDKIHVYWKKNIVTHRKENLDYVGQMAITIMSVPILGKKLLAISDIILMQNLKAF